MIFFGFHLLPLLSQSDKRASLKVALSPREKVASLGRQSSAEREKEPGQGSIASSYGSGALLQVEYALLSASFWKSQTLLSEGLSQHDWEVIVLQSLPADEAQKHAHIRILTKRVKESTAAWWRKRAAIFLLKRREQYHALLPRRLDSTGLATDQ